MSVIIATVLGRRPTITDVQQQLGWSSDQVLEARFLAAMLVDRLQRGENCCGILYDLREVLGGVSSRTLCVWIGLGHYTLASWQKPHHRWYGCTRVEQVVPPLERFFQIGTHARLSRCCTRRPSMEDLLRADQQLKYACARLDRFTQRQRALVVAAGGLG